MLLKNIFNLVFTNDEHEANYRRCIEKFQCKNLEYSSTCYLAAHPEIFKCFTLELQVHGPFDWYFEYLHDDIDTEGSACTQQTGSTAPLTNQTHALVHLALNLWNGSEFDFAEVYQFGILISTKLLFKPLILEDVNQY
jgi:hypothetical protein